MTNEELYYLPASELLRYIQAERERLIKEKVIKKSKQLPPITEEEKPYELPQDWEWVRLGDVVDINLGLTHKPEYIENGIPFISVKDISKGNLDFSNCQFISREKFESMGKGCKPQKGDILFGRVGTLGKPIIVDVDFPFAIFVSLGYLRPYIIKSNKYIKYLLESSLFYDQIKANVSGAVQVNLNTGWLSNFIFPLPPLYIQDQIVRKLEQLSETKNSLLSHAESQLSYTKKMREALLQEAIRGELVPQDEHDEPASILLEKIKVEKERLIKEKVIKKSKPLPLITEEEKTYELPDNWEWVRLGEIGDWGAGATPLRSRSDYYNGTIPWLKTGELNDGKITESEEFITELALKETSVRLNKPGDVLIAMYGATIGKLGILEIEATTNQACCACSVFSGINNKFLFYFLLSMRENFKGMSEGGAQPNISKDKISKTIFPLPPLAEQERIIAKLDELMAHCDQLELKAEEMKQSAIKLFETSLKEALMPE